MYEVKRSLVKCAQNFAYWCKCVLKPLKIDLVLSCTVPDADDLLRGLGCVQLLEFIV